MTNSLPRPEVIITHESDLDGLVAGVLLQRLAQKLFNADVRLEAYHYNNWRQRELREKSGWIADLTFEPRMDRAELGHLRPPRHRDARPRTRCSSMTSTSPPA